MKQTKLQQVREALESNPKVKVVYVEEHNSLPYNRGHLTHTIDMYVAPVDGLYTAGKLQEFMMNLIPGVKQSSVDVFRDNPESLSLGKLYFDEPIGLERIVTHTESRISDSDLVNSKGFTDGYRETDSDVTKEIGRRIWVRVFPDERYIQDLLAEVHDGQYSTRKDVLRRYKPNLVQKLVKKVTG